MGKRRRNHDSGATTNEELTEEQRKEMDERLRKLRQINADLAADRISWEERVRRHEELVPGIGSLDSPAFHHRNGRQK